MNKEIPVFFAVDNGYIPFLSVALRSLIDNTSKENTYAIKILYTNVTEENKIKIKKYETEQESEKYRREPDHRGCDLEAASDILFSDLVWNSVPADL